MAKPIRILLLVIASLVVLAVAALLLAWWLVDTERAGEHLETRFAEALDMEVDIGKPPVLNLFQGASITLVDPELRREGQVLFRADSVRVRMDMYSLLSGDLRPIEIHLQQPELSIERISPGVFNIQPPGIEGAAFDEMSLRRVQFTDARLSFLDRESEIEWLLEDCDMDLRDLGHAGGEMQQVLATLATKGDLHCNKLSQDQFTAFDLSIGIEADQGFFEVTPVSATVFEGALSGQLTADFSVNPPEFSLASQLSQFDLAAFMAMLEPESTTPGKMDLDVDLNAHGETWQTIRNSAAGTVVLTSGELILEGYDLDEELDDYSATQRFNLIDVGAVFLAGPVGLVASRGYAFTGLLEGSEGSTRIEQMVSQWRIDDGVAQASDVAFRTPKNRLALAGALDFNEYRFDDMRVAVVDSEGCPIVEQRITGPFREPEVEQPNFLVTVAGPLLDLVDRGVRAITDEDCEAFYTGSIQHP